MSEKKVRVSFPEWDKGVSAYNSRGEELPDPRPMEPPLDFSPPIPLSEEIRRLVSDERLRADLEANGIETFEEADDFDIPEDEPLQSPWEENFETGKVWTRDQEIRSGIVSEPDYNRAKELVARANEAIKAFEDKKKGSPTLPSEGKGQ